MSGVVLEPRQVLGVGRNYGAHARELGHDLPAAPLLFWKPIGCVTRDGVCPLPTWAGERTRIDYEGEIVLVLGRDVGPGTPDLPADPWDAVGAVTAGLDLTDRTYQEREPQWVRAKGFFGACALGAGAPRPADPDDLGVRTWKGGARVQEGHTSQLLFPFRELIAYLHGFCRLGRGDAILTGTPSGVGPVAPGDELRVEVTAGRDGPVVASLELRVAAGPDVPAFRRRG